MSQPLDDVEILDNTVRENGSMSYTLKDGHVITAAVEEGKNTAATMISWCGNVREIVLAREQAKEKEAVETKASKPKPDIVKTPTPMEYAEAQVKAMEVMYDMVSIDLKAAMKEVDHCTQDLVEAEKMGRQWQDILASLKEGEETDAELQLRTKRDA